jgi:hypothetical protein
MSVAGRTAAQHQRGLLNRFAKFAFQALNGTIAQVFSLDFMNRKLIIATKRYDEENAEAHHARAKSASRDL